MLNTSESFSDLSNPYHMFRYSIRNELTRRYYERRLQRFFDFNDFLIGSDIENRCNSFTQNGKDDTNWALNKVIAFLQFQKERSERCEIAPATLGIS